MTDLKQHPLSAAFPAMLDADFQALKDSIENIGVQNPITLYEGMVIDGWHRYSAATAVGLDCPTVDLGDVDPRDFVLAQNKARRHVTQAQLALATTAVYAWKPVGANQHGGSAGPADPPKTTKELAAIAGVGVRSIEQAKAIQTKAVPEVLEAVKRGDIGGEKAAAIAKLPKEEQAAAIHQPASKRTPNAVAVEPSADRQLPAGPHPEPEPEHSELDLAREEIADLHAALALANLGEVPEADRTQAAELIEHLRAEIKGLSAQLRAVTVSRDFLMQENSQMKQQMAAQRREIDRLKRGVE